METIIDLKKKIHEFIDQADERILRVFDALIKTEKAEEKTELGKKLLKARKEKMAGTLKTVNPKDIWESIS